LTSPDVFDDNVFQWHFVRLAAAQAANYHVTGVEDGHVGLHERFEPGLLLGEAQH